MLLRLRFLPVFALAAAAFVLPVPVQAVGDPPKPAAPKCGKFKQGSKGWKKCMGQKLHDDDAIYEYGAWLAGNGEHHAALDVLRRATHQADPRIQTMIGFALRQTGRVDEAMAYYFAALATAPDRTTTRQYLGEAYLQKGDIAEARAQLAEIGARCGTGCADYRALAVAIERAS